MLPPMAIASHVGLWTPEADVTRVTYFWLCVVTCQALGSLTKWAFRVSTPTARFDCTSGELPRLPPRLQFYSGSFSRRSSDETAVTLPDLGAAMEG